MPDRGQLGRAFAGGDRTVVEIHPGPVVRAAVADGVKGFLCDKPLATTLEEMDRIVEACAETPLLLALERRWMARYRFMSQR